MGGWWERDREAKKGNVREDGREKRSVDEGVVWDPKNVPKKKK
jgi:hypothetical protein